MASTVPFASLRIPVVPEPPPPVAASIARNTAEIDSQRPRARVAIDGPAVAAIRVVAVGVIARDGDLAQGGSRRRRRGRCRRRCSPAVLFAIEPPVTEMEAVAPTTAMPPPSTVVPLSIITVPPLTVKVPAPT